jgi:hypothetical protein
LHLVGIVLSVALLVVAYVFLFKSLNEHFQMQHEINAKLPTVEKFEPMFWELRTRMKFRQLQKELLSDSPRPQRYRPFQLTSAVLFICGALLLAASLRK